MHSGRIVLFAFLCAWLAPFASAQSRVEWKWKQGSRWNVTLEQTTTVTLGDKKNSIVQTIDMTWTIEEVDANQIATMSQIIDRIRMQSAEGELLFDSESNEQTIDTIAPAYRPLLAMVGLQVSLRMTQQGAIEKVLVDEETSKALNELGINNEAIEQSSAQSIIEFPDTPLDIGDAWSTTPRTTALQGMKQTARMQFQYVGDEDIDSLATAKFKGIVASKFSEKESADPVTLNKQDMDLTVWFDTRQGFARRSELKQQLQFKAANNEAANRTVDQIIRMEFRLQK